MPAKGRALPGSCWRGEGGGQTRCTPVSGDEMGMGPRVPPATHEGPAARGTPGSFPCPLAWALAGCGSCSCPGTPRTTRSPSLPGLSPRSAQGHHAGVTPSHPLPSLLIKGWSAQPPFLLIDTTQGEQRRAAPTEPVPASAGGTPRISPPALMGSQHPTEPNQHRVPAPSAAPIASTTLHRHRTRGNHCHRLPPFPPAPRWSGQDAASAKGQPWEGGTELSPQPPRLRGGPLSPPRASLPGERVGSRLAALAQLPGIATEQPRAPAPAPPVPPQHGEMELNLFCIRLSLALRSTKRLKNNKEKAKPSAIITSL